MTPVLFLVAVLLSLVGCDAVDGLAVPSRRRTALSGGAALLATRLAVFAWLWVLWFGLSGRVLFAAVASVITVAVFVFISREKQGYLAEPLVFSDLAFLSHLPRHPDLFYLGLREGLVLAGAVLGLGAVIVLWVLFVEAPSLSLGPQIIALGAALAVPLVGWACAGPMLRVFGPAARLVRSTGADAFVSRVGLLGSLAVGALGWVAETGSRAAGVTAGGGIDPKVDAVVVVQAESFTDLRRAGLSVSLPAFDALTGRAFSRGRLDVPCYGAYTIRPEFAVTTGVAFEDQGFGRFHPYLDPRRFAARSLPGDLAGRGWDTVFVHPHDARFFRRHVAVPALGFGRVIGEEAFAGEQARFGPYVSDAAVADRILAEAERAAAASQKLFVMAVTMESHDPYGPGRLAETDDPVEQYRIHAENSDRMLARLVDGLDRCTGRSILLFYGDHAPLLPGFESLARDSATDYIALECGRDIVRSSVPATSSRKRPDELNGVLRNRLGLMAVADRDR